MFYGGRIVWAGQAGQAWLTGVAEAQYALSDAHAPYTKHLQISSTAERSQ